MGHLRRTAVGIVSTLAPFFLEHYPKKEKIMLWVEESPLIWLGIVHVWKKIFVLKERKATNIGLRGRTLEEKRDSMQKKWIFGRGDFCPTNVGFVSFSFSFFPIVPRRPVIPG